METKKPTATSSKTVWRKGDITRSRPSSSWICSGTGRGYRPLGGEHPRLRRVCFPLDPALELLDALYFCVVSLATVGYGDLAPETSFGRAFAIVYIINGVAILLALSIGSGCSWETIC